jgi:hypothetical protein
MEVITNHVPRDVVEGYELTEKEREKFDYIRWDKLEEGEHSETFFRYKGELYDVNDCEPIFRDTIQGFKEWDGIFTETFFSGVVFKYANCYEQVIVGRYYS